MNICVFRVDTLQSYLAVGSYGCICYGAFWPVRTKSTPRFAQGAEGRRAWGRTGYSSLVLRAVTFRIFSYPHASVPFGLVADGRCYSFRLVARSCAGMVRPTSRTCRATETRGLSEGALFGNTTLVAFRWVFWFFSCFHTDGAIVFCCLSSAWNCDLNADVGYFHTTEITVI